MNGPLKLRSGFEDEGGHIRETGSPERVCTIFEGKHKMTRSKVTRSLVAGAAAIATMGGLAAMPTAASAQAYPYAGGGYYDPCQRDTVNRSTTGGLTGAAIGAAIGSGMAARGVRTEGAVLGGLLGAVVGAKVGQSSAACAPGEALPYGAPPPAYPASQPYPAGRPYTGAPYDARPYNDYSYNSPYQDGGYGSAYGYPVNEAPRADECQLAESPIYLPDGRMQKRFVRVCRDASGAYQVVD